MVFARACARSCLYTHTSTEQDPNKLYFLPQVLYLQVFTSFDPYFLDFVYPNPHMRANFCYNTQVAGRNRDTDFPSET